MGRKVEFCIVPPGEFWMNERRPGLVRHEIFFGTGFRQKSIRLGLVVFITPDMHNMGNDGVHNNHENDLILKRAGQRAAMEYYRWDTQQFINEFGKNYL